MENYFKMFRNAFNCFLSDTPAFKRLQPWPKAVGILARGRASPGQRPWESWPEAVRVLTRGRARGIFPGPNPSEPQVVHDVASKRQIISFLLANSHCCSRSRKADWRHPTPSESRCPRSPQRKRQPRNQTATCLSLWPRPRGAPPTRQL